MKNLMQLIGVGLLVLLMPSCDKEKGSNAHLSVRMTDAPSTYDAVMIDVQGLEVIGSGGNNIMLNTSTGIYNLLDFSNGLDTLIASGNVEAGNISQIRLVLGSNNSVVVNGAVYPLATPSGMQSGLKLQIHQSFEPGISYHILLDFDANQSIILKENGEYQLKPVIRTIDAAITGSIKGSITPIGTVATVTTSGNDVYYSTTTNNKGEFLIAGLPEGTYDITITPTLPLQPVNIIGKTVTVGASTNIGIISL